MSAANALTLIRKNVETILDWSALIALVAPEDISRHDQDVEMIGPGQEPGLAARAIDFRLAQRTFKRFSSSSWGFTLRFVCRVDAKRLPVGSLEDVEWLILRGATYLDNNRVPGSSTALTATTPAIVDEYLVTDLDPELDVFGADEEGWESVIAIVVNGTIDYASLMAT